MLTAPPTTTLTSVRQILSEAETFLREGDPYGATARAKTALEHAHTEEAREEVELALERFQAARAKLREKILLRQEVFTRNELRAAGVVDSEEQTSESSRRGSWIARLFRPGASTERERRERERDRKRPRRMDDAAHAT